MNEVKLKSLIKESRVEMPFSDFEQKVMASVYKEEKGRHTVLKNIRLSWVFFTLGALLGITTTILLPFIKQKLFNIEIKQLQVPVLLIITALLIWLMDVLLKFTNKYIHKHKMH